MKNETLISNAIAIDAHNNTLHLLHCHQHAANPQMSKTLRTTNNILARYGLQQVINFFIRNNLFNDKFVIIINFSVFRLNKKTLRVKLYEL